MKSRDFEKRRDLVESKFRFQKKKRKKKLERGKQEKKRKKM